MKITTHKTDRPSEYKIFANGRDTGLVVMKGYPAKFGMVQEWDVCDTRNDGYLFSAKGKSGAIGVIQHIADILVREEA